MIMVAIDKTDRPLATDIDIQHANNYSRMEVYSVTAASTTPRLISDINISDPNKLAMELRANSVNTIRLTIQN
jgi:hypothetical protein